MSPPAGRPDGLLPAQGRARRLPRGVVAETPGPGQTSVWDHPRPPLLRPDPRTVVVTFGGVVCRTSSAPHRAARPRTRRPGTCPWSAFADGVAAARAGALGVRVEGPRRLPRPASPRTAGSPPRPRGPTRAPTPAFAALADHVALYAGAVDEVTVAGEVVRPQPGGFYGGWVTDDVVGPFKGGPGSTGW